MPLADVARTREPVFLPSREAWMRRYPRLTPVVEATRHHANAVVPLVVDERLLGVLGLAFEQPRDFDDDTRALVLERAQSFALPQARASRLELCCDRCDPRLVVHADRAKARQILVNLLGNSVKFTPPGGSIRLAAAYDGDDVVVIRVTDTGSGIAAPQLERIFEPFVQVKDDPAHAQGTGLGLAISRDLARGMGGDITVDSTPVVGSTFTLVLPGYLRTADEPPHGG